MTTAGQTTVLIYQPGKVGSVSIAQSLAAGGIRARVESAHVISEHGLRTSERWYRDLGVVEPPAYIEKGRRLAREIESGRELSWKVITIFREPIARMVSGFFENASMLYPEEFPKDGNWSYTEVEQRLLAEFRQFDPACDYTSRWFDQELRCVFGVDLYEVPFDHTAGFIKVRRGNIDVLVLQYEKLEQAFRSSIAGFLGADVPLEHANESKHKPYSACYEHTLAHFSLPADLCERVLGTRFATHFYTPGERAAFAGRWSG